MINETLECLSKTFLEKNNEERTKAEKRLKQMEENILVHIRSILLGLTSPNMNQDLKLSVILYLKNIIRIRVEMRMFCKEEIMSIIQIFVELTLSGGLNEQLLQNLNVALTILLNSNFVKEDPTLTVNVCSFLLEYIRREGVDTEKILQCKPLLLLIQTVLSCNSTNPNNIFEVIQKHFDIVDYMINLTTGKLKTFNLQQDAALYLTCVDVLRSILDYLFLSILKLKKLNSLDNIFSLYVGKYLPFTIETISYANQTEGNLILFTGDKEVDTHSNTMKAKAFQLVSYIVQCEGTTIKNQSIIDHSSKVVNLAISSLTAVVDGKLAYLSEMGKNNDFPDNGYDALLFQIMLFLSRFLVREPVLTQFTGFVKNFVLSIIFPLLISNKQEIIMMKTDGENFHNYYQDIIKDHKQKSFKVSASFLLVKLCERFDGLATFMINFCLQLMDYCLNNSEVTNIPNYTILNQSTTSPGLDFSAGVQKILTGLTPEIQMDTSLLVLLILREQLSKSTTALAILRLVLESQADKLFSIGSEIIKDKLSLLFGYYLDELYQEDEVDTFYNHLYRVFEFLFLQVLNFHNNPGIAYSASFALNQLIYYKSYCDVSNNIVRKIMPQLIQQIKEIEVVLFFDVIMDIVQFLDIEDQVLNLCREVANRILKEVKSAKKEEKELNVYVGKCFNILRTVLERNKMFNPEGQSNDIEVVVESNTFEVSGFEKIIEPVVIYIKNPNKINFDEEIIHLMTNLLQNAKKITNLSQMILPYLEAYMIKHDGMTEELYELLNLYIAYDISHSIFNNSDGARILCNMIKISIEECDEYAISPIIGSLLAQVWLQSSNSISLDIVSELLTISLREMCEIYTLFNEDFDSLKNSFEVFPFTGYITTLYSGLISYPYLVMSKLSEHNKLIEFISSTELMLQLDYFSTYQSKIVILGICSLLSIDNLSEQIQSMVFNKLLFLLFAFLSKQKREESKKLKIALKKEIDCNFINSDEEDMEDEDEDEEGPISANALKLSKRMNRINSESYNYTSKEEKQILKVIEKLKTPCKEIDEYQTFTRTLHKINSLDQRILPQWEAGLGEDQRSQWKELLHTRRITVNYSGTKVDVPRRTVKIRRTENTNQ